jgi:hypothetical protein
MCLGETTKLLIYTMYLAGFSYSSRRLRRPSWGSLTSHICLHEKVAGAVVPDSAGTERIECIYFSTMRIASDLLGEGSLHLPGGGDRHALRLKDVARAVKMNAFNIYAGLASIAQFADIPIDSGRRRLLLAGSPFKSETSASLPLRTLGRS